MLIEGMVGLAKKGLITDDEIYTIDLLLEYLPDYEVGDDRYWGVDTVSDMTFDFAVINQQVGNGKKTLEEARTAILKIIEEASEPVWQLPVDQCAVDWFVHTGDCMELDDEIKRLHDLMPGDEWNSMFSKIRSIVDSVMAGRMDDDDAWDEMSDVMRPAYDKYLD